MLIHSNLSQSIAPWLTISRTNTIGRSAITVIEAEGDARSIEPLSQQPDEPAAKSLFACHCGHAKAALLSPIEEEELKEDNCSKCVRVCEVHAQLMSHQNVVPLVANIRSDCLHRHLPYERQRKNLRP